MIVYSTISIGTIPDHNLWIHPDSTKHIIEYLVRDVGMCECVSMWVMTDGPYKSANLAKSPFKTPAWKAPTFPPSGGDTILGLIPWMWWKLIHSQSCLPNMGPKAHPPPLGGPLFIWNPLNLNTFEYLCFNEANNLICILSSETQNKAIFEGNFQTKFK